LRVGKISQLNIRGLRMAAQSFFSIHRWHRWLRGDFVANGVGFPDGCGADVWGGDDTRMDEKVKFRVCGSLILLRLFAAEGT